MPKRQHTLSGLDKARVYSRDEHPVSRKLISPNALKVMRHLNDAGFNAFLVGGAVRDMILGNTPKDFDVATDATPEQIRKIFRNARIIGRRFRIIHVQFGREIIEVTTFRGNHDGGNTNSHQSISNNEGMLLRDNVFGTIEEDALRRDFSVNALYYSSKDFCVYDFTNGVEDIRRNTLRIIGDPVTRYKEDPVRMLRAVRFASKLDFALEPKTEAAIAECAPLLRLIPVARLFDESIKLFCSGYGEETLRTLIEQNLLTYLLPESQLMTDKPAVLKLVQLALRNSDARLREGKTVTPTFIFAALLWPQLQHMLTQARYASEPRLQAMQNAGSDLMLQQQNSTGIPKRIQISIREIWELQVRLETQRQGNRPLRLMQQNKFRAAYDFLLLREQAGEIASGLGQWWTAFIEQAPELPPLDNEDEGSEAPARTVRKRKPRKRNRS